MMLLPALMRCALASLAALMLASCSSGINIPIDKASIAFPRAILDLPQTELLEVQVYIDDEAEPSYRETNIDLGSDTVALKFDAPQGEHLFTLVFVYADPEIKRVDGSPWELARWHSAPVLVEPDAPVMLEVSSADYTYADDDGDGVSNLDELKARTRPDDPADVPVTNDPNLDLDTNPNSNPGPGPDPAPDPAPTPGPDPNPPVPPPPPDPKPVPPKDQGPPPDEPANPSEPEVPAFAAPVGLWSGTNERDENVLGMFYGTRLLISDPASIYDSAWSERGDGGFAGVAAQYQVNGARAPLPVPFNGERNGDEMTLSYGFLRQEQIAFSLDPAYQNDSSLDLIARQWGRISGDDVLVFPVGSDGTLSGASDSHGCVYEGNFSLLDTNFNLYAVQLTLSEIAPAGCNDLAGNDYTGFAVLTAEEHLRILASNGAHALSIELELDVGAITSPDNATTNGRSSRKR